MIRLATLLLVFAACKTPEAPRVIDAGPMVCAPGSTRCGDPAMKSQPVYRCNDAGTEWEIAVRCMNRCANSACVETVNSAY